jgi:hypothetical protein
MEWRKPSHNMTFMRANAQSYIAAGCNACTNGMHKSILPGVGRNFLHGKAKNESIAYKFNGLVTAHLTSLDPTENLFAAVNVANNVTVSTSNCSKGKPIISPPVSLTVQSMAATDRSIFGLPMWEYLKQLQTQAWVGH